MLIQPLHIATRGLLDGQYGVVTRGYIVLPDIVSRFPSDADVGLVGWLPVPGVVEEILYEARVSDHPVFTLEATVDDHGALLASVVEHPESVALVTEVPDLVAAVVEIERSFGEVQEPGFLAELAAAGSVGEVVENESSGAVEGGRLVGVVEDEPPGC